MIISDKILAAMRACKSAGWDKVEQWNQYLDDESVRRYIERIRKDDGVSYDEAWELCRTDPKYSLGLKMCSPSIVMKLTTRGGPEWFRKMLTDEEKALFDSEVVGKINFRKVVKHEFKRQKKRKEWE